jgi:hypothetical protein
MVVDRQKVKTRSESRRYRVADRLMVKAGRMVRQAGQTGTWSRQTGGYKVQKQARVKTGRTRKRRIAKGVWKKHTG